MKDVVYASQGGLALAVPGNILQAGQVTFVPNLLRLRFCPVKSIRAVFVSRLIH